LTTQRRFLLGGAVNAGEADSPPTFHLATAGKTGSFTAKNAEVIKLKSAVYSATNHTVTLTPKKPFTLTKPVQLLVYGTGPSALQDTCGRAISGANKGQPGSNAIAILSRTGTTIDSVPSARARTQPTPVTTMIDALFNQSAPASLTKTIRENLDHALLREPD
jgi:hypothetical protein